MDTLTHLMIGFLIACLNIQPLNYVIVIYITIMAVLPDLDVFLFPLSKKYGCYYLKHRGASHSLFIAIPVTLLISRIFYYVDSPHLMLHGMYPSFNPFLTSSTFFGYWFMGFLLYATHLFLDTLTNSRIPLLYPFTKKEFCISAELAVNYTYLLISSSLFWLGIGLLLTFSPDTSINFVYARIIFWIYIIYFSYRLLMRIIVECKFKLKKFRRKDHKNSDFKFVPTHSPLSFRVIERKEDETNYIAILSHYYLFPIGKKVRKSIKISKSGRIYDMVRDAFERAQDYHFFPKMGGVFPLVKKEGKYLIIHLMVVGMASKRKSMYYRAKYRFDTGEFLDGKQLIDIHRITIPESMEIME